MKTKSIFIAMILVVFTFLVGCNADNQASDGSEKLNVYTTIFPLEDFTKKIGGDHVEVKSVFPPGSDAHTFEPSTKTMSEMASADVFIYTGVGVEGFADKAKDVLENEDVPVVVAGNGIELRGEEEHNHEHEDEAHEEEHNPDHEDEAPEEEHHPEHEDEAPQEDHTHDHPHAAHEEAPHPQPAPQPPENPHHPDPAAHTHQHAPH
ncbi:zinc ABC transporter solute-binding protein, partial [Bacillus sp. RO2]|uniref:metal ABC transporter substrate-binding protein n=1 Tax=Bacillus sp. RO2 TaxID=2723913 RepID=UPI00145DDD06